MADESGAFSLASMGFNTQLPAAQPSTPTSSTASTSPTESSAFSSSSSSSSSSSVSSLSSAAVRPVVSGSESDDEDEERMEESDFDLQLYRAGKDDEALVPNVMADDAFVALLESFEEQKSDRQKRRQLAQQQKLALEEEKYRLLTNIEACRAVTILPCDCLPTCAGRFEVAEVERWRRDMASKSLGDGSRKEAVKQAIMANSSDTATQSKRQKKEGGSVAASKIKYVLSGKEVCRSFFAAVLGITETMLKDASASARAEIEGRDRPSEGGGLRLDSGVLVGSAAEHEAFDSARVMQAVSWVIQHAKDDGAELLPFASFSRFSTVESLCDADLGCRDMFYSSQVRLLEHEVRELYTKYSKAVGEVSGLTPLSESVFGALFKKHPRLANVVLARLADTFADCDTCSEHKAILRKTGNAAQKTTTLLARKEHLDLIWRVRHAYDVRCLLPAVDELSEPKQILNVLSIVIDGPSLFKLRAPVFPGGRNPKSVSSLLSEGFMGVIVHKVKTYAIRMSWATPSKINQTIECLHHVLLDLQKEHTLPKKLVVQMDNSTASNKTPAVLIFVAWLIEKGIFTEAEINLLFPGHTHIDIDQLFSAWLRRIIDRYCLNVTRQRIMEAIRTHRRDGRHQPVIVGDLPVRSWDGHFIGEAARLQLGRLGVSLASGDAVYKFMFKKMDGGGVAMTYRQSDADLDVHPMPRKIGATYVRSDGMVGEVTGSEYDASRGVWNSYVEFPPAARAPFSLCVSEPPVPIVFFPPGSGVPDGSPAYEPLDTDKLEGYNSAKRCIKKAIQNFAVLRDTDGAPEEWHGYFDVTDSMVRACLEDKGAWYRGVAPQALRAREPGSGGGEGGGGSGSGSGSRTPFEVDPITHRGYTNEGGRKAALVAAEARRAAAGGSFAAVQLLFGAAPPEHHKSPYCIARLPDGFAEADVSSVLEFEAFFLSGKYSKKWAPTATPLRAAKGLVFCTGLDLEAPPADLTDAVVGGMHLPELKEELSARGATTSGNRDALVQRLKGLLASAESRAPEYMGAALTTAAEKRLADFAPGHLLKLAYQPH